MNPYLLLLLFVRMSSLADLAGISSGEEADDTLIAACDFVAAFEHISSPVVASLIGDPNFDFDEISTDFDVPASVDPPALGAGDSAAAVCTTLMLPFMATHLSVLEQVSNAIIVGRRTPDESLDADVFVVSNYVLRDKSSFATTTMDAFIVGADRKSYRASKLHSAAASIIYEQQTWRNIEDTLVRGPPNVDQQYELLHYFEFASYDGVDFTLKTKGSLNVTSLPISGNPPPADAGQSGGADAAQDAPLVAHDVGSNSRSVEIEGKATKILHAHTCVVAVVRLNERLFVIRGNQLTWLQASDRSTAENLVPMLQSVSMGTEKREQFKRKTRGAVVDSAAYNLRAERVIKTQRPGWSSLVITCLVHILAGLLTKSFDLLQGNISGQLAFTLSLGHGNEMHTWQRAMLEALRRTLRLEHVEMTSEAVAFQNRVVEVFIGSTPNELSTALLICAKGDWRRKDGFIVAALRGETYQEVLHLIESNLLPLLGAYKYTHFPRHRWVGHDLSMMRPGILCNLYNYLEDCYTEFLILGHGYSREKAYSMRGAANPNLLAIDWAPPIEEPASGDLPGVGASNSSVPQADADATWAEVNRRNRGKAMSWVSSRPGDVMLAQRAIMTPLMDYMMAKIHSSGDLHATVQQASVIGASGESDAPSILLAGRKWALLEAARGHRDNATMEALRKLHDVSLWAAFADSAKTVEFNHLLFRLISREGAVFHNFVVVRHTSFPFPLFLVAADAGQKHGVLARCKSSRDGFSDEFIEAHADIGSVEARIELAVTIVSMRDNTVPLEHGNSSLSKVVKALSNATAKPSLMVVCAEHICAAARRRERLRCQPAGSQKRQRRRRKKRVLGKNAKPGTNKSGAVGVDGAPCRRGGGGPWRAYISAKCRGVAKAVFKTLSQEYKQLSVEERTAYDVAGAEARLVHAQRGTAFGLVARAMRRLIHNQTLRHRSLQLGAADPLALAPTVASVAVALPTDTIPSRIRAAKTDRLLLKRFYKQEVYDAAEKVERHRQGEGTLKRDVMVNLLPRLAPDCYGLQPSPSATELGALLCYECPVAQDVPRMLATAAKSNRGLFQHLEADFDRRCKVWFHHMQAPLPAEPKRVSRAKPSCFEARACICGPVGNLAHAAKLKISDSIKSVTRDLGVADKLKDGCIVLCLGFVARQAIVGLADHGHLGPGDSSEFHDGPAVWLHISYVHGSPWFPVYQDMRAIDSEPDLLGLLTLRAQHVFSTMYEFLVKHVDQHSHSCRVQYYILADSRRPVSHLDPTRVKVKALTAEPVQLLFVKQPSRKRVAADIVAASLGELDDMSDDLVADAGMFVVLIVSVVGLIVFIVSSHLNHPGKITIIQHVNIRSYIRFVVSETKASNIIYDV
jgi:hypothetical protein